LHYDPAIALPFRTVTDELAEKGQAMAWAVYDQIQTPTLLLRGADSDLLSAATAAEMGQRGPRAKTHTFAGVGHAPTLIAPDQIDVVADFLFA
jgi:pimeloyl-ACP methyl ester carboxylesterase